uniref:Acyl-coenzyme A oxidase n=1 Tax=Lygus hesperus TaxID=30085 RepID=A0A146LJI1_LYGHE
MASLEEYRRKASFDVRRMLTEIEPQENREIKKKVWHFLASNPLFHEDYTMNGDSKKAKDRTAQQLKVFLSSSGLFANIDDLTYATRTKYLLLVNEGLEIYNANLSIKLALGVMMFSNALNCLGTERHQQFYKDIWAGKILSCFAITELEHGSDTKELKTSAEYDHSTREFVINTPGIGAAKCWVGNLGQQCTHALLMAQLVVNGTCHGLHGFVVPIRDPETLRPYLGITVGDIGEKSGLHGIDNGFIMFKNYRIPRENILNRLADVNENGEYQTFTDPLRMLGASLEILSAGRVGIVNESSNCLLRSIVIAVRYAAQRRQFRDSNGIEKPIIEYQTHQYRLMPYLAATYAIRNFAMEFSKQYVHCVGLSRDDSADMTGVYQSVGGIHAVLCCSKSLITWTTQRAIQEAREACGGHGYHKSAGLGDLRNNHDPRVTFEGDNTVLLQQTSNWLLKLFNETSDRDFSEYPLCLVKFLTNVESILPKKFVGRRKEDVCNVTFVTECFEWLLCWLLKSTNEKMTALLVKHNDRFVARNQCQVFKAKELSLVFAEYIIISHFKAKIDACQDPSISSVLWKLCSLYGLWCLHSHLPLLYQGGYCNTPALADCLSDGVLLLCEAIKPDAVALVDAIAPPDFILNSAIGCYNGKVYENLMNAFRKIENGHFPLEYPDFWKSKL